MATRRDGRAPHELRPVTMQAGYAPFAEGSVLICAGSTRVLCAASVEDKVPRWLAGQGRGWVTAEYGLLPRSTQVRVSRERSLSGGRTHEIQRLIGRSLRAVTDLQALGELQITLDCDVLVADGSTRTTAITGAWVALALACQHLRLKGLLADWPLRGQVAAVSVGLVEGHPLLDLDYDEDARAEVDANLVMTGTGGLVEVQGTAERSPFSRKQLDLMLELGAAGLARLFALQRQTLQEAGVPLEWLEP